MSTALVPLPPPGAMRLSHVMRGAIIRVLVLSQEKGDSAPVWRPSLTRYVRGEMRGRSVHLHDVEVYNRTRRNGAMCPIAATRSFDWWCVL